MRSIIGANTSRFILIPKTQECFVGVLKGSIAVTSPYSSNLLQEPAQRDSRPQSTAVSQVSRPMVAAPSAAAQVVYVPQPVVVGKKGDAAVNAVSFIALALLVALVGVIALAGGYYAMHASAPSAQEAQSQISLALREGYVQGRQRGLGLGRTDGAAAVGTTARLRAATEQQKAWDTGYQKGLKAGERSYRAPSYRSSGYRSGYRYSYPRINDTVAALSSAQSIANATGAPVDVEVFG